MNLERSATSCYPMSTCRKLKESLIWALQAGGQGLEFPQLRRISLPWHLFLLSTLSSQRIYNWTSLRGAGQGVVADLGQKRSKKTAAGNLLRRRCSEMLRVCPVHDLNGISTDLDQLLFPCFCHPFYSVFHLQRQAPRSKFLFEYQSQRPPTFEVS